MQLIDTPQALSLWSDEHRLAGRRIALVPTMGALHDGHLALIDVARSSADVVVVSVFVNPLQFNRTEDFDSYPRPIEGDLEICRNKQVDVVYAPTAATMYPQGFETTVRPGALADVLEGAHRPGHFLGVTTVVAKLFGAARPHLAVFGQKDFQQLAIIRRMTLDLDMNIEIVGMPTVREADGLAMSSRNRRLTPDQRAAAVCVSKALSAIAQAVADGEHSTEHLRQLGSDVITAEPLASLEQLEIVDAVTLASLEDVGDSAVAVTAVWFGEVRLIDNLTLPTHSANSGPPTRRP